MKTLHNYLARELTVSLGLSIAVFTFALLFGRVLNQLHALLTSQGVLLVTVLKLLPLLIPYVLMFALPMSVMTAMLLVFGKLSADRELMAMRASGLSLGQIIWPAYLFAAVLTVVCLYCNLTLSPQCRERFKKSLMELAQRDPLSLLQPDQTVTFGNIQIYCKKREGNRVETITAHLLDPKGNVLQTYYAASGIITADPAARKISVDLHDVKAVVRDANDPTKFRPGIEAATYPIDLDISKLLSQGLTKLDESDFTLTALINIIQDERLKRNQSPQEHKESKKKIATYTLEIEKRFSWALACLVFTLLAVPLGIRTHRSETSINAALALLLIAPYYFLTYWSGHWKDQSLTLASLWLWTPNVVFSLVGLLLLARARRA